MSMSIHISRGSEVFEVLIPPDSSVNELCMAVESATGVFIRNMKLIFKGRVITNEPPKTKLSQLSVANGTKMMLMAALSSSAGASSSSAQQQQMTKGQIMAQGMKRQKQEEAKVRIEAMIKGGGEGNGLSSSQPSSVQSSSNSVHQWPERRSTWIKTKIISMRGMGIESIPIDLFMTSSDHQHEGEKEKDRLVVGYKAADMSENKITTLPPSLFIHLSGLNSLRLNNNQLGKDEESAVWMEPLAMHLGPTLSRLNLDNNCLTNIPASFFERLDSLQHLSICSNMLTHLPDETFGKLVKLETMHIAKNRIVRLPLSIGGCTSLMELDASNNQISLLPPPLSSISSLQILRLSNNLISSLPPLLSALTQLHTLSCEFNPITLDQLRGTAGFECYEARRRARVEKQLEGGAMFDANRSMAQGADQELYERWK